MQCWEYGICGVGYEISLKDVVVVGRFSDKKKKMQGRGLRGNLWGFEGFIWDLENGEGLESMGISRW